MFDVFDITFPQLLTGPDLEIRQGQGASGFGDDKYVYFRELKLSRILPAVDAYSNIESWTGSMERSGWTVLLVAAEANEAALNDQTWQEFLEAVAALLSFHTVWRVTCESDCDQYTLERLAISPATLVRLIDAYRVDTYRLISLIAETPRVSLITRLSVH